MANYSKDWVWHSKSEPKFYTQGVWDFVCLGSAICQVQRLSPRQSTFALTDLPLHSFSQAVLTAGWQNWNHSASSCDCWNSVWLRQRARLAIVHHFKVSRYFNFVTAVTGLVQASRTRTGAEVDALTSAPVRVCEGHGCTKCSVTVTLPEHNLYFPHSQKILFECIKKEQLPNCCQLACICTREKQRPFSRKSDGKNRNSPDRNVKEHWQGIQISTST